MSNTICRKNEAILNSARIFQLEASIPDFSTTYSLKMNSWFEQSEEESWGWNVLTARHYNSGLFNSEGWKVHDWNILHLFDPSKWKLHNPIDTSVQAGSLVRCVQEQGRRNPWANGAIGPFKFFLNSNKKGQNGSN